MSWTCYLRNDTGEPMVCSGSGLPHGQRKGSGTPPLIVTPGQSATFECDRTLGNVSGWASSAVARGGVTITGDVTGAGRRRDEVGNVLRCV
jgi:hypothetical protein